MKTLIFKNALQLNCNQVAIDHLIEHLESVAIDKSTDKEEEESIREKIKECYEIKKQLELISPFSEYTDEDGMKDLFSFIGDDGGNNYPNNTIIKQESLFSYANDLENGPMQFSQQRADDVAIKFIKLYNGLDALYGEDVLDQLTKQLTAFQIANGLELRCADEQLQGDSLTKEQENFLREFIERWNYFDK